MARMLPGAEARCKIGGLVLKICIFRVSENASGAICESRIIELYRLFIMAETFRMPYKFYLHDKVAAKKILNKPLGGRQEII